MFIVHTNTYEYMHNPQNLPLSISKNDTKNNTIKINNTLFQTQSNKQIETHFWKTKNSTGFIISYNSSYYYEIYGDYNYHISTYQTLEFKAMI